MGRNLGSDPGSEVAARDFRRNLLIEVYDEAGRPTLAYKLFRCWVSEFQSLPDLDASANAVSRATSSWRAALRHPASC
jgi:phage tail-like protein